MRYLLIDKIVRIKKNKELTAIKNVALSEDVFTEHFAGYPVMPGALQIEAIAQACTALIEFSGEFKVKAILALVDKVKFRKLVKPGDQMIIKVNMTKSEEHTAYLNAEVSVKDKIVTDGNFVFSIQNDDKYYPGKLKFMIESVYSFWLEDAEIINT